MPYTRVARALLPFKLRRWLRLQQRRHQLLWPRIGSVNFGQLRRLTPISSKFGMDRGLPIDRYYIEAFLEAHAGDIRGRVLELGDDDYTRRYGRERVAVAEPRARAPIGSAAPLDAHGSSLRAEFADR